MNGPRWNILSVEEPNAFRIAHPPPNLEAAAPSSSKRDPDLPFTSDFAPRPHHTFTRPAPNFNRNQSHPFEPASWLASADLSSPSFSAHDFLRRVLSPKNEKTSRPTQIPVLDDAFDADAALAALDTVESALRKKRENAKREENIARDELRKALHLSAKKREQLVHTADTVSTNISTFSGFGRQAAHALSSDISVLKALTDKLAALQDARDLVSLFTASTDELDAVRVSRFLATARKHVEDGSLASLLSENDMSVAREEIQRYESELAASLHTWMKNAVDSGNTQVVRDCAMAAEELGISQQFTDSFISHAFVLEQTAFGQGAKDEESDSLDPADALEKFRVICWETSNTFGEIIPTICESFPKPSRTLASVIHGLLEKKAVNVAETIMLSFLRGSKEVMSSNTYENERPSCDPDYAPLGRRSMEMMKSLAIADAKENWRETARHTAAQRKKFLIVSTTILRSITKLKAELFTQCRVPGAEDVDRLFGETADPCLVFANRWVSEYLVSEKAWLDEQFGTAFFDITRIEAHVPRLAPRETSDPEAYHRYRSFYSHISSQYQDMTRKAIESTHESLSRVTTVLSHISETSTLRNIDALASVTKGRSAIKQKTQQRRYAVQDFGTSSGNISTEPQPTCTGLGTEKMSSLDDLHQFKERSCKSSDVKQVLHRFLNSLIMSYLANSETILQAASHLLPVSESDARLQELWVNGASPLTAYIQAVDTLSRSNEVLDEFLLTLEPSNHITEMYNPTTMSNPDLSLHVSRETRELLHRDLATGLSDLGGEAQGGVKAAISAVRARLVAILSSPAAKEVYKSIRSLESLSTSTDGSTNTKANLDLEASPSFLNASTFIQQQLESVLLSLHSANREFVIFELSIITRDVVLKCWCDCNGLISVAGALQLVADGRVMMQVFQNHRESASNIACLPAIGQLFLESADGLWKCVEAKALANVDAKVLIELLKKREDCREERVVKVCQSLGATLEELTE